MQSEKGLLFAPINRSPTFGLDILPRDITSKNVQMRYRYLLLAIFFSIVAYINTINNEFVRDDHWQIIDNKYITNFSYLRTIFSTSIWSLNEEDVYMKKRCNYYRPLHMVSYMITYHLFGLNPRAYHVVNILYNIVATLLAFLIAFYFLKEYKLASIGATLFTLHPTHTEVVACVCCVPECLYTIFYLGAFLFFIKFRESGRKKLLISSSLLFLISLLSKEPALTFLPLIFIYDLLYKKLKSGKDFIFVYFPFFILLLFYLFLRVRALGGFAPVSVEYFSLPIVILNGIHLFAKYLYTLVLSINLNVFYVLHIIRSFTDIRFIFSFILLALLLFSGVWSLKRGQMEVALNLAWLVLPILPVLDINIPKDGGFALRFLYLSTLPFFIFIFCYIQNSQGLVLSMIRYIYSLIKENFMYLKRDLLRSLRILH